MLKTIMLGIFTLAISFFVGTAYINAQEATSTPTPTVTDDADEDTPTAAPRTGFGG